MTFIDTVGERRTSADIVFETLHDQIVSLKILPGTKISEVETAKMFGLSRQPVRDAFSRLSNLGLIHIRPQRSTIVRHFSLNGIQAARFIRTAVEVEVLRAACLNRDTDCDANLHENLERQQAATDVNDADTFHQLDYEFHQLLCRAARSEFAFGTILEKKAQVDRLCMLSLTNTAAMSDLLCDHKEILDGVMSGDAKIVDTAIRRHLDRLTPTIKHIHETHRNYFED